jgi:hypothetical protein
MRIPSVSAANQDIVPNFGQQHSKTSPAAYATRQPVAAGRGQKPVAANSSAQVEGA